MELEVTTKTPTARAREAATEALRLGLPRSRQRVRDAAAAARLPMGARLCQALFALVIGAGLAYAFVVPPADFAYDLSLAYALSQMVCASLSIWMLQNRLRAARPFIVVSTLVLLTVWAVDLWVFGAFDVLGARMGPGLAAGVLALQFGASALAAGYMAFSPGAKAALSRIPDSSPAFPAGYSWDEPLRSRVRTWTFWRDLLLYFMVFSFLGHWAEMWFCYNIYLGVFMGDYDFSQAMLWSQWLFPYTAEGVALVAVVLLLHPAKQALLRRFDGRVLPALLLSVVVIAAVCTTIDFTCGMIANQDYSLWDYRALPFNFMGQVCLQNSTVYTVAAVAIVWVFYPLMDRALRRLPRAASDGLFVGVLAVYAFSALLHFMYLTPAGLVVGV